MKLIKNIAILLTMIGGLASCDGMDTHYKDFIKDGPIVYIGKVDSLKAFAGRDRIQIEWRKLLDPRAKTATIFWENGTKSVEVQLELGKDMKYVIDGLAEGSYIFDVYTYDGLGNTSIKSETTGTVYGAGYEKLLFNSQIKSAVLKNKILTVTFAAPQDNTLIGSEIRYINTDGEEETANLVYRTVIKGDEESGEPDKVVINTKIEIKNLLGKRIEFRSVYLPEPTAIDYFYTDYDEYLIK